MSAWRADPADRLSGQIRVPGDKSISHRALMFGAIADGVTDIEGFLAGEDCLATLNAMRALGVPIEQRSSSSVLVRGVGREGLMGAAHPLDMGNAGTAMRLSMGLLAGQRFDSTLTGDDSLSKRPMERVAAPLRLMGARIDTREGRPPVRVHGGSVLQGIEYAMPMASAQLKSALLIAGLFARGTTAVSEPAPTRDHTERMLTAFGVPVRRERQSVSVEGGARLRATSIVVPADFSSAAFFMVAGCIAREGSLLLQGVGLNPTRTGLLELLRLMGAQITLSDQRLVGDEPVGDIHVRSSRLRGIEVPAALVAGAIDEFPVFFIAAACAEGKTVLRGAEELRVKESDRLAVMSAGLRTLGAPHVLSSDGMTLGGREGATGPVFSAGRIDSHGDHRIAMAFAVASLQASGPIEICDTANVATSFPGFVDLARGAGLALHSSAEGPP